MTLQELVNSPVMSVCVLEDMLPPGSVSGHILWDKYEFSGIFQDRIGIRSGSRRKWEQFDPSTPLEEVVRRLVHKYGR